MRCLGGILLAAQLAIIYQFDGNLMGKCWQRLARIVVNLEWVFILCFWGVRKTGEIAKILIIDKREVMVGFKEADHNA
ncbi:hypothetical protein Q9R34_02990 [Enterobacter sp. BRE11]|nr:hypothetical protein [Enterobacter sp. BRE11]